MISHEAENPRAFERILESIKTARSLVELERLAELAHQHFAGVMLEDLEVEIAVRKSKLPPNPPREK